jgi:hypothetical protein
VTVSVNIPSNIGYGSWNLLVSGGPSDDTDLMPDIISAWVFGVELAEMSGTWTDSGSTWTGALDGTAELSGSWAGSSSWSGTIDALGLLSGSWAGASAWSGAMAGLAELSGAWAGVSDWSGSLAGFAELSGAWAGGSDWTGLIGALTPISGAWTDSGSTWTGALAGAAGLSGSWAGSSTWTGDLTPHRFIGSWAGSSRWTGRLHRIERRKLVMVTRTVELEDLRATEVQLVDIVADAGEVLDSIVGVMVVGDAESS